MRANLAAIAALRAVQREARPATPAEQEVLARWSGWGAVPAVFDDRRDDFAWAREQLSTLLSPAELAAARRNTLNAHYTDAALVTAIWAAARALGFRRGRMLEPGCGSGNFIAFAPAGAQVTGIELDPVTAAIAAALYPDAEIRAESFANTQDADGSYDLAIGNVPFGDVVLHDRRHNPAGHSIHNHFIVKALRLVHPGGLVMVLTSRYTMDARNPAARREIAALADLAGAIRLPGGAHQRAAGTGVVTDLVVLRRREPGRPPGPAPWERTRQIELDGALVPVNEFFADHPDAVLGEMSAVNGAYRDGDLAVRPAGDTIAAFSRALDALVGSARARGLTWAPATAAGDAAGARPGDRPRSGQPDGYLRAHGDGTFTKVVYGAEHPHPVPAGQAAELRHLLGLRDTARALLEAEGASAEDTPEIGRLRAQLGRRYDAYLQTYGPLNRFSLRRTGRTDPATGEPAMARIRPRQGGFDGPEGDPFAALVYALEEFDPVGQRAAKAAIFRERVIAPRAPRLGADTPADALAICLDTCAEVRLAEVARLLGTTEQDARGQLGTLVFDDPGSRRLVPAAEYLSGNVRGKLRAAEQASEDDPRYTVNVTELRRVIPPDLTPGEIDARLGAAWIGARYIQQFLREMLDDPQLRVEHPGGQTWVVRGNTGTVLARSTWGTGRYPAPQLAQALLEQRSIQVHDTITGPDGRDRTVLNVDATLAAQEKGAELAGRFADWAWEDPGRAGRLARTYNDRFNSLVLRSYDDARLSLPGLALTFRPRAHQVAAVARVIHEPSVLLAHDVGAGKTAEMIMGVTELRRLGLVRKPAIVVPNHMLEQFAREWLQLYPQARVMVAGREDLRRDRRRQFVARCATGTWDGIVMSRSAFERIPLSAAEQRTYMERELARMRKWIEAAKKGEGLSVKKLERALLRAEERLQAKLDSVKDQGITFEATGLDYLCIDEAHGYKNLHTPSNITDAAIDGSMRASDLDMKVDYLRRRNGRRVVTFATATPVANSVTEAYVMQRYLRPDLLEAAGIEEFDTWAATFGQAVTQIELAPEGGSSFRMKSRFARFANVPEMLRMLHVAADVKTAGDLALPVPHLRRRADGQPGPETVIAEPSGELLAYVRDLGDRASKVRNRAVGPDEDNMLKISGDGRRAALDLRLLGLPQTTPGKVDAAAGRIAAIWAAHRDDHYLAPDGEPYPVRGSLQLVFCDLGTPGPQWNIYDELRHQLTARGLPREAIRFIHEAKTDRDKGRLFAACRTGSVAVLVGSTEKMGIGTNVQDRAIALHHLDAPWRPADVAQREGRILRQGNLNPEVEIIRYVTERSFDGYMWQTLERKARFINQVMHGRLDTREIADIGDTALSFSEVKALATGNPLLMDKAEADAALARLQRAERAHRRNQDALRQAIDDFEDETARLARLTQDIEKAIKRRQDTHGEHFTMTVEGMRYRKRADAGQHLKQILEREITALTGSLDRRAHAGELGGFPVSLALDRSLGKTQVTITLDGAPGTSIEFPARDLADADPAGLVTRLEHRLNRLEERKASALADTEHARREIAHARDDISKPFPHATELAAARDRARQIDEALQRMARPGQDNDAAKTADGAQSPEADDGKNGTAADGRLQTGKRQEHVQAEPAAQAPGRAPNQPTGSPPGLRPDGQAGTVIHQTPGGAPAVQPPGRATPPVDLSLSAPDAARDHPPPQNAAAPRTSDSLAPKPANQPLAGAQPEQFRQTTRPPPADSQITQANRAAVAASEAYRAGDLDQARQLTDQAAALDPSRADLWQQHRTEIAAKRLFLTAREAHAGGDHRQAQKLIDDATQLDPRMQTLWNHHLSGTQASQHTPATREREPSPGTGTHLRDKHAVRVRAQASGPTAVSQAAPQPPPACAPDATARTPAHATDEPSPRPSHRQIRRPSATQAAGWQPPPIRDDPAPRHVPSSQMRPTAQQASHDSPDPDPASSAYVPEPEQDIGPAAPLLRSSLPSGPVARQADVADWRDSVIETGRQSWQPRVVQPYTPFPAMPQANSPEIGG